MMPGFRHRNRPTSLPKLRQRPLLRHPQGHHPGGQRGVLCTLHFRVPSQGFPGGGANLGGGVLLSLRGRGRLRRLHRERHRIRRQRRHLHAAGVFPPRHRRRQQLHVGGEFLPCLHRERRRQGHLGYLRAGRVFFPRFHRHGHRRRRQLHVGGGIPTMSSSGAVATSVAAATSSRGGGIPAAVPAAEVTGGTHVSGSGVGPPAVVGASHRHPHPTLPLELEQLPENFSRRSRNRSSLHVAYM